MTKEISKSNVNLSYLDRRLDEIQMSSYERLRAKAQLERAEAVAEMFAAAAKGIGRAFKALTAKSPRHAAPSAS